MSQRSDTVTTAELGAFHNVRPKLIGLAYRILGSMSDAEDAVQDTYLKWAAADRSAIRNTEAWLMTACSRRCLDLRKAGDTARVSYVGAWLPEPIQMDPPDHTEKVELASSLSMAFLLMLERLTVKERAAYLLHDVFDQDYAEIAEALDLSEANCRQLVSRARRFVGKDTHRADTPAEHQAAFLALFKDAVATGKTEKLSRHLVADIRLSADGGGKVPAILEDLTGASDVSRFVGQQLHRYWAGLTWIDVQVNGTSGARLVQDGETTAVLAFAFDTSGCASAIYIIRNPDKLKHLDLVAIH